MGADLDSQARVFAAQTSELLNKTVTNGVRIASLRTAASDTIMGCGVKPSSPFPDPIPISVSGQPCVWLYLFHSYDWDPEQVHLMMTRSTLSLYTSPEMEDDQLVVGIDYIRQPANKYPGCHIHVSGERSDLDEIYLGTARSSRQLRDLHLPVGGKRFRPTLEDMVEFMITEEMVEPRVGWEAVLQEHRSHWETIQVKAAARRSQHDTAEALREAGWTVTPPAS